MNKIFEDSYNQGYKAARDYAKNYMMTPNYMIETPRYDFRRFMDDTIDSFVLEANPYSYIRGKAFQEMAHKRKQQIKRILSVEDWEILNGTNFTSTIETIRRFIGILEKIIDKGVFDITPEHPQHPQRPIYDSSRGETLVRYYVIQNGSVCQQSYGSNTENFKKFIKSPNTVLSEVVNGVRWICVKCSPTEPEEATTSSVLAMAQQLGWIEV